jgi:hypothetical protein
MRISINGVEAGTMSADVYREIYRKPFRERSTYLAQFSVVLNASAWTLIYALSLLPALFAMGAAALAFSPGQIAGLVIEWRSASPESVEAAVHLFIVFGWFLSTIVTVLAALMSPGIRSRLGWRNVFRADADYRVRQILEVTSEGYVAAYLCSCNSAGSQEEGAASCR